MKVTLNRLLLLSIVCATHSVKSKTLLIIGGVTVVAAVGGAITFACQKDDARVKERGVRVISKGQRTDDEDSSVSDAAPGTDPVVRSGNSSPCCVGSSASISPCMGPADQDVTKAEAFDVAARTGVGVPDDAMLDAVVGGGIFIAGGGISRLGEVFITDSKNLRRSKETKRNEFNNTANSANPEGSPEGIGCDESNNTANSANPEGDPEGIGRNKSSNNTGLEENPDNASSVSDAIPLSNESGNFTPKSDEAGLLHQPVVPRGKEASNAQICAAYDVNEVVSLLPQQRVVILDLQNLFSLTSPQPAIGLLNQNICTLYGLPQDDLQRGEGKPQLYALLMCQAPKGVYLALEDAHVSGSGFDSQKVALLPSDPAPLQVVNSCDQVGRCLLGSVRLVCPHGLQPLSLQSSMSSTVMSQAPQLPQPKAATQRLWSNDSAVEKVWFGSQEMVLLPSSQQGLRAELPASSNEETRFYTGYFPQSGGVCIGFVRHGLYSEVYMHHPDLQHPAERELVLRANGNEQQPSIAPRGAECVVLLGALRLAFRELGKLFSAAPRR